MGSDSIPTSLKKGDHLHRAAPESIVLCLDEMGPEAAKSHLGQCLVKALSTAAQPAERAKQEIDYEHRGKGYISGAFRLATAEAFTAPFPRRALEYWSTFLEQVDNWVGPETERVYAVLDNLSMHEAANVLLFSLIPPALKGVHRSTFVRQAANLWAFKERLRC